MSNKGKYIDRNPTLRTAGKLLECTETVGDALKIYSPQEAAFNIMNMKCKKQLQAEKANASQGHSPFLPNESLKDLLSPELKKSRFVAFKEKFSEDMFFKKPELGQVFPLQSKPSEYTNENFTYGLKNMESERLYELVCPNKTPQQVKREFLQWHDKYLISHKHYLPAERVKRNYNEHFNPEAVYGICHNVDKTGQKVKSCLQQCERMVLINKVQKQFLDRTNGTLGEKIDRYNLNLDPQQTFGVQTKHYNYNVRALIENVEPSAKNMKIIEAISYVHKLRRFLFNHSNFHMWYDLKTLLNKYDEKDSGFITFDSIMKTLKTLNINANKEKLRLAIEYFEMLKDDNENTVLLVNWKEFWKMLHNQYPLPRKAITNEKVLCQDNKQTTYRILCSDRQKTLDTHDLLPKQSIEYHTTVSDLICPDIPMLYGLVPSDFEVLRSKDELKRIFKRLLPLNFDHVWQFAWSKKCAEATCKMSVNEFRAVIQEYNNENLKCS
ncbi:EF-hand domain-containing family member B [Lucilia cuprina]|nr:EF-hand domain-containing family member B [Lucilia cuprina]